MPLEGESETLPSTFAQVAVVHPVSALNFSQFSAVLVETLVIVWYQVVLIGSARVGII